MPVLTEKEERKYEVEITPSEIGELDIYTLKSIDLVPFKCVPEIEFFLFDCGEGEYEIDKQGNKWALLAGKKYPMHVRGLEELKRRMIGYVESIIKACAKASDLPAITYGVFHREGMYGIGVLDDKGGLATVTAERVCEAWEMYFKNSRGEFDEEQPPIAGLDV